MEEKKAFKKEKKEKGDPDSGLSGGCPGGRPWGIFLLETEAGSQGIRYGGQGADSEGSRHGHHLRADGIQLPVAQGYL